MASIAGSSLKISVYARLLSLALTSGLGVLLAVFMETRALSVYFLAVSVASTLGIAAQFGLGQAVVRWAGIQKSLGINAGGASAGPQVLAIAVIGALLLATCVAVASTWWGLGAGEWSLLAGTGLMLALVWGGGVAVQGVLAECFRADSRVLPAVIFGGLLPAALCIGLLALAWLMQPNLTLFIALWVHAGSTWASVLIGVFLLRRGFKAKNIPVGAMGRDFVSTAGSAWLAAIVFLLTRQVDVWMLAAGAPPGHLAIYGLAARIADLVALPLLMINMVTPQLVAVMVASRKKGELEHQLRNMTSSAFRWACLAAIPAFAGGMVFVGHFAQSDLGNAACVLGVLVIGQLLNVACGSCGVSLLMAGHGRDFVLIGLLGLFFLLGLGAVTSVSGSALGMALAACATQIVLNLGWVFMLRKRISITTVARIWGE